MIETIELERIKAATGNAISTELHALGLADSEVMERGGRILDAIDAAAADATDPRPFGMHKAVAHRELSSLRGEVVKRVESKEGELHTVWVRWKSDGIAEAMPYSPIELVEL